jgi:hypothetical protein
MKAILIALLVATAIASDWDDIPDSLPSCYTTLPFSFSLAPGYTYKSVDIPSWAIINEKKGIITGQYDRAGAWPFTLTVGNQNGKTVNKQYILNVIDHNSA